MELLLLIILLISVGFNETKLFVDDVCGRINGQRIFLDFAEKGTLMAKAENNINQIIARKSPNDFNVQKRCTIEFVSCPSCIVKIQFKFLNISRTCGRSPVFDTCGCDYVWIYEPAFEQSSGEQFCGRFIRSNASFLDYTSQTRKVAVAFLYSSKYEHAFTLEYTAERNQLIVSGLPKSGNFNNISQIISSPFFPSLYPSDLCMEQIIKCETNDSCKIILVFTDFLISPSSIMEFFDWSGERLFVAAGNIFRPPVIVSSGPSLIVRFYANGASNLGYKAHYSFSLSQNPETSLLTPDIDCGGHVINLGGGITMMDMVKEGSKSYDCVWLVKPQQTYFHFKTHLYLKVVTFASFAGSAELTIRQGLTSDGPIVENLKLSLVHFYTSKETEHVVPISKGFYIEFRGLFRPESRLGLVYSVFNYNDCRLESDFQCRNLRCISIMLVCDGFDHCGDNSDENNLNCSRYLGNRKQWADTPNFLFPKSRDFTIWPISPLMLLSTCLGLIGLLFATIIFLYRVNTKKRHQAHIQHHNETIQAILEDGVSEVEEEIIIPDDPPEYEYPPEYEDVIKIHKAMEIRKSVVKTKSSKIKKDGENSLANSRNEQISKKFRNYSDSDLTISLQTFNQNRRILDNTFRSFTTDDINSFI